MLLPKNYLTTSMYATKHGFHRNYIWQLCKAKRIPGAVFLGRTYFIPKTAKIIPTKGS